MDAIDRAIIAQLEREGRLTNTELASRVNLSPTPCLRRVRNLERAGVIRGYHAAVDPAAIGRGFQVVLHVEMALQDRKRSEAFERAVEQLDEVTECRRMFGRPDYLLFIAVSDATAYEQLLLNKLADLPGVARTNSQLTMKLVKATPAAGGTAFGARL
jgi:Lrp/AsnC family leucine-responsive transcriptional regulator